MSRDGGESVVKRVRVRIAVRLSTVYGLQYLETTDEGGCQAIAENSANYLRRSRSRAAYIAGIDLLHRLMEPTGYRSVHVTASFDHV